MYKFTRPFALTAMRNRLAFWNHEEFGLELTAGVDEVTLALVADAWSRTFRSRAVVFAATTDAVETATACTSFRSADRRLARETTTRADRKPPGRDALDEALNQMTVRYGIDTSRFVAMQLEYTRQAGL